MLSLEVFGGPCQMMSQRDPQDREVVDFSGAGFIFHISPSAYNCLVSSSCVCEYNIEYMT